MQRLFRTAACGVLAAATLALAVTSASANRLSVSNSRFRATWANLEFGNEFVTIRCPATLEGSFHSATIRKVPGALVGYVTRGIVQRPCINGIIWAYNGSEVNEALGGTLGNSLPWHLQYSSFSGVLPNIVGITFRVDGQRTLVRGMLGGGITVLCNYTTNATNGYVFYRATLNAARAITELTAEGTIAPEERGGFCPTARYGGVANLTLTGTVSRISVTLI